MSTLLNGVNAVLKKVHIVQGDSGELTSLTDSARQVFIDVAVQTWNELIDDLYSVTQEEKPRIWSSNTLTLVTGTRTYALQTDIIELRWPFHNQTTGDFIREYPGGYLDLIQAQLVPATYTGMPIYGAWDPTAINTVYLDRIPSAGENGNAYTYHYQSDSELTTAAAVMPFNEAVYRALIPAVSEVWRRHQQKDFDEQLFKISMGRAARLLSQKKQRENWHPHRFYVNESDPFHA